MGSSNQNLNQISYKYRKELMSILVLGSKLQVCLC